jgi:hypothetical protein
MGRCPSGHRVPRRAAKQKPGFLPEPCNRSTPRRECLGVPLEDRRAPLGTVLWFTRA